MPGIAEIRQEYKKHSLSEADLAATPLQQFHRWWDDAITSQIEEVNAMTLATATREGIPSARIVLLKEYGENGFVFFTNYESRKGKELADNPLACLVFFWKELERQVRITGSVEKISDAESEAYFLSRPAESRIGAWASPQSTVISARVVIEERAAQYQREFGDENIPRPPHWGGYVVKPYHVEFWQGRPGRLHDRFQYSVQENGGWKIERLAP